MCGIAGFVRWGKAEPIDQKVLEWMTRALAHRGPDDEGYYVGQGVFLGHRRLAVIDIEGGHQPMQSEDGRIAVIFNGEIYNHKGLRKDLERLGHQFRTRSDTEVLVHGFEAWGVELLQRLRGMFALAIWDGRQQTLLLARDLMGKKPLYWGEFGGEVVFASELKALMRHPAVRREVDPQALYRFLTLDYVPTPWCILKGIRKVEPGGYVLAREGEIRQGVFADIEVPEIAEKRDAEQTAGRVFSLLVEATGRRLESDVPLGVFLSGGLDSTAVLLAMAEHVSAENISTFTIGFDDPSFDESGPARVVAKHLGTKHHERILTSEDALRLVRECPVLADEPLGDYSLIPTFLVAKFARERVTVALSGDGGDELFYGYPTFIAHGVALRLERLIPKVVSDGLLRRLVELLPVSDRDWSLDYRLRRFVRGLKYGAVERHFVWIGGLEPDLARACMAEALRQEVPSDVTFPDVQMRLDRAAKVSDLRQLAFVYARLYLQDGVLVKADRASMAVGLEVRCPFLDQEMVALAFSLDPTLSLRRFSTKRLLRKALKGRVPEGIVKRPKKGFGMPLARWLKKDLRPLLLELLDPKRLKKEGFLDPQAVTRLVDAHLSGRANLRKELFNLMVFQMWLSRYIL